MWYVRYGKRFLDIGLVVLFSPLWLPLFSLVACLVWLFMGRPIFFLQERPGKDGKPFRIIKFRTMVDKRDEHGNLLPDRERLTPLGIWLRKTSLDEIPELINVLKGDMSLVGPRPLLFRYMPYFRERERLRFTVLPGITGLAQVSGRNYLSWDERLELDAQYAERVSFLFDLKILWKTFIHVLFMKGVSPDVDEAETWLDEERSGQLHD